MINVLGHLDPESNAICTDYRLLNDVSDSWMDDAVSQAVLQATALFSQLTSSVTERFDVLIRYIPLFCIDIELK